MIRILSWFISFLSCWMDKESIHAKLEIGISIFIYLQYFIVTDVCGNHLGLHYGAGLSVNEVTSSKVHSGSSSLQSWFTSSHGMQPL